MSIQIDHEHDINWDNDVFTLPRTSFDTDKEHIIVEYYSAPFSDGGGYAVHAYGHRLEEHIVDGVSKARAKRVAKREADERSVPILTPVQNNDY